MKRLEYFCLWAASGDRKGAAHALLETASAQDVDSLLPCLLWKDADVADFEANQKPVLVQGRWGRFWLAPKRIKNTLLPPAPRISPQDLVALARGVVDVQEN